MKKTNSQSRISELLKITDDKQSDMARKTKLSKTSISRYVNGIQEPNQDAINRISKAYRINPAWLMGYDVDFAETKDKEILKMLSMLNETEKDFVIKTIKHLAERG